MNVKMATQKNEILIKNSSNLSEIFKDDINISILKRTLDNDISNAANFLLKENCLPLHNPQWIRCCWN